MTRTTRTTAASTPPPPTTTTGTTTTAAVESNRRRRTPNSYHDDHTSPETTTTQRGTSRRRTRSSSSHPKTSTTRKVEEEDTVPHRNTNLSQSSNITTTTTTRASTTETPPHPRDETTVSKNVTTTTTSNTSSSSSSSSNKGTATMDVLVHRLRHLDYRPAPIVALASCSSDTNSWIAVARKCGRIECSTTTNHHVRTISVVTGSVPLTQLTWLPVVASPTTTPPSALDPLNDHNNSDPPSLPILMGVHGSNLYVVDVWERHQLVAPYTCPGGTIRGLVVVRSHNQPSMVAIGSHDGAIRIVSVRSTTGTTTATTSPYQWELVSTIPTAGAAVVSLAAANTTTTNHETTTTTLFAGMADGTIRRYDHQSSSSTSGQPMMIWKSTLRMTVECYGRPTPTMVWTIRALSDGTVVTGDSLGHVQFWNGVTGTLMSTFDQNDNKADILALAVTADECKVFASGVDSRVVCIERQKAVGTESNNNKWIVTHAQRPHTHDVTAMTIVKKFKVNSSGKITKQTEVLLTGGIDTKLCTYHVSEFGLRRPRSLYPWPSLHSPIVAANQAKILTMLREHQVDLYALATAPTSPQQVQAPIMTSDQDTFIGTILVKKSPTLSGCAISTGATFLALCDSYAVFLFQLQIATTSDHRKKVTATSIPISIPKGSLSIVAIQFIQESHLVFATSQSTLHIYSLEQRDTAGYRANLIQTISPSYTTTDRLMWLQPIHSIQCSGDGEWMATTRNSCNQSDGRVDIYRRSASDGSYQFWWSLPTMSTAVTAMSLLEWSASPMIAVACVNFSWYLFDLAKRCLSDWSVQAGYPLSPNSIPQDLTSRNDYPIRIGINPANPTTLLIVRIPVDTRRCYCKTDHNTHSPARKYIAKRSMFVTTIWLVTLAISTVCFLPRFRPFSRRDTQVGMV